MFTNKLAVVGAILLSTLVGHVLGAEGPRAGDSAPTALGLDRDGNAVDLAQGAGKVQVVTFWATWCAPCRKELPMLEGIQRVARDRVRVVAVNIEERGKFRTIAKTLDGMTLTIAHDFNKVASSPYGVDGIPHLVIIGRDGKILAVHQGYSEESIDGILAEINGELAKPPGQVKP
jgi:thiol-disulfide isomerase/thioredoxin